MGRLDGKRALISGTGGGIGRAAAVLCAREGAHVVGCDLDPDTSAQTVELVRAGGGRMDAIAPVDLATEEGAGRWVQETVAQAGGIDVLVNNASAIRFGPIDALSFADWSFTIRHELDIVFLVILAAPGRGRPGVDRQRRLDHGLTRRVLHAAERARRGQGRRPRADLPAGRRGRPAWHPGQRGKPGDDRDAAYRAGLADPDGPAASIAARVPLGRWGQPEDVAHAIVFLASDESRHVSGANIPVDGGAAVVG